MDKDLSIQKLSTLEWLYYQKHQKEIHRIPLIKIADRLINEAIYKTAKSIARQLGTKIFLRKEISDRQRRKLVRIRIGGHSYYFKNIKRADTRA